MKEKRWALIMLNRTALTVFLYASFLYFLKRIVFVKRHVWFFRIYILITRNASIPTYSGLSLPAENLGKVKNHGFEVIGTYRDHAGDFEWG